MRATSFAVLSAAALVSAVPCTPPTATVVVETAHGGAFNDRTNKTIAVPIGHVYVNEDALAAVSTLYLLGPNAAICTPYQAKNGTGSGGLPFYAGHPSLLSTNSVVVGSIVCATTN
ncbi:hypothetical protein FHL15_010303 [Xylaria flabelliformis]|uniref:Uncharacterized protein n=1 Tax=Xylaria flabelliformis TaxID=2512241 RepID=A0A553HLK2_9PEZI|nr:hypothetical protein FHL15_010303 [Xylaria flabelliformis]